MHPEARSRSLFQAEPWAWALFPWVRVCGDRPAWTSVSVVDDTSQTLRDEVEYLWDLGIHALSDHFKVLRQVREEILLPQGGYGQRQQPLEAFSGARLGDIVGSQEPSAHVAVVNAPVQVDVLHPPRMSVLISETQTGENGSSRLSFLTICRALLGLPGRTRQRGDFAVRHSVLDRRSDSEPVAETSSIGRCLQPSGPTWSG